MKTFLVVRAGSADPATVARHGDFGGWFEAALAPHGVVEVADGVAGRLPPPGWHAGIVVTGSLASVTEDAPWMRTLGAWLVEASRRSQVLGVCFGHQLLGAALGARVERNPAGPEMGTVEVTLTPDGLADPLFAGLPPRLAVQQSHFDHVAAVPPGAVLLATGAGAPVQAFRLGERLRGVQFHPEFDAARCRSVCEADRPLLEPLGAGTTDRALATIRETPEAASILERWARVCR
ncbi:MAG: GMP synthase [Anaeromyxobacteraceae bacterium]